VLHAARHARRRQVDVHVRQAARCRVQAARLEAGAEHQGLRHAQLRPVERQAQAGMQPAARRLQCGLSGIQTLQGTHSSGRPVLYSRPQHACHIDAGMQTDNELMTSGYACMARGACQVLRSARTSGPSGSGSTALTACGNCAGRKCSARAVSDPRPCPVPAPSCAAPRSCPSGPGSAAGPAGLAPEPAALRAARSCRASAAATSPCSAPAGRPRGAYTSASSSMGAAVRLTGWPVRGGRDASMRTLLGRRCSTGSQASVLSKSADATTRLVMTSGIGAPIIHKHSWVSRTADGSNLAVLRQ